MLSSLPAREHVFFTQSISLPRSLHFTFRQSQICSWCVHPNRSNSWGAIGKILRDTRHGTLSPESTVMFFWFWYWHTWHTAIFLLNSSWVSKMQTEMPSLQHLPAGECPAWPTPRDAVTKRFATSSGLDMSAELWVWWFANTSKAWLVTHTFLDLDLAITNWSES